MRRFMALCIVGIFVVALFPGVVEAGEYNAGDKLVRGVSNSAFGWTELFTSFQDTDNVASGFAQGITGTVGRTLGGLVETATFPVKFPVENYRPLMEPATPLGDKPFTG